MGLVSAVLVGLAVWLWLMSPTRARMPRGTRQSRKARLRRFRRRSHRDDRLALLAQAPIVADLFGAAVAAGASTLDAISVVSEAVQEPAKSRLQAVVAALRLGASPTSAWNELMDEPALAPIASAVIRSQQSGSPLSFVLDSAASDMRHAHRAEVETQARAAGVRAVAPLALCFLPAYLLVGVVPVVAGFAGSLL